MTLPEGTILAWDRAWGMTLDPPAYAIVKSNGRSKVIIAGKSSDGRVLSSSDLPGYVYERRTHSIAINRIVPEGEWPDGVCTYMARRALLGEED